MTISSLKIKVIELKAKIEKKAKKIIHLSQKLKEMDDFFVHHHTFHASKPFIECEFNLWCQLQKEMNDKYMKKIEKYNHVVEKCKEENAKLEAEVMQEKRASLKQCKMTQSDFFQMEKVKYIRRKFIDAFPKENVGAKEVIEFEGRYEFDVNHNIRVTYEHQVLRLLHRKNYTDPYALGVCIDEKTMTSSAFLDSLLVKTFIDCIKDTYLRYKGTSALPRRK